MIRDKSLMAEWEKAVTAMPTWDYGPDDAAFTKGHGLPIRPPASPKLKRRSPLSLLHDYSSAWADHGVRPPDLVFQTHAQGYAFFRSCLHDAGPSTLGPFTTSHADGMCIARVVGINLIWPEK